MAELAGGEAVQLVAAQGDRRGRELEARRPHTTVRRCID
jgi:hypothetical protein